MEKSGDKYKSVMGEEQTHESFGAIQIVRISCSPGMNLFDSSIKHSHIISLRVCTAKKYRAHGYDRVQAGREIVEVYMSSTQFADMITNMNNGSGTPCTIQHIDHKRMEKCPVENQTMLHNIEFKERMKSFADTLKNMRNEANDFATQKMSKKDAEAWNNKIRMLTQEIEANIPFFNKCFTEQMDKTVTEAKGEIESFVQHRIIDAGLESLFGQKKDDILSIDETKV